VAEVRVLYLHCTDEALREESKPRKVTETFTVPAELARRFHFWRRVYGLWAKDQYVLHSSEYPEVVLEIMDASKIYRSDFLGREAQAERYVSQIGKLRRAKYRELLLQLHSKRKQEISQLRPELQRIAQLFTHIKDPGKYAKAAYSLRFQRGQRDFIAKGLTVGPKYLPAIEPLFEEQGVPKELSRLAYIESSFNLGALSKVGASGVYQIMPETGRQYLRMIPGIDERNDPIKAATAAAKLLRLNYEILGSWPLAVTAYNHGVGGLKKAVRATGTNDLGYMVHNYSNPQFQFASKNFFCGFLAILATLEEHEKLFPDVTLAAPFKFQNIRLVRATGVKSAAKKYGMTPAELLAMNPDIQTSYGRNDGMLPRGYTLKVPPAGPAELAAETSSANIRPVAAGMKP
jgi:membrane-bound lytic murein transglycosylase D